MNQIATRLDAILKEYSPLLEKISDHQYRLKPQPHKWSKIEILGHLVDSAQNNIRRFVVAQYENQPQIVYKQDYWVAASNYQQYRPADLIQLWSLLNKQICMILTKMPETAASRSVRTEEFHSIAWLAEDYVRHLLHHLHQVVDLEPVAYP